MAVNSHEATMNNNGSKSSTVDNTDANLTLSIGEAETRTLVVRSHPISYKTALALRVAVVTISVISLVILAILGTITLGSGIVERNPTSMAFGIDCMLDCVSSAIVLWRFRQAEKLYSRQLERKACISLGILFIVSCLVVVSFASYAIDQRQLPKEESYLPYLAGVDGVVCLLLCAAKTWLAFKLESVTLLTDGVNSGIGAIVALSIIIGSVVYQSYPHIWYIDPLIGIMSGFLLSAFGVWLLYSELCQSH